MSPRRVVLVAPPGPARRLDLFLAEEATRSGEAISRRGARRLIEEGAVYVDRRRARIASRPVAAGATVEVWLAEPAETRSAALPAVPILYLDPHLVAVDKPAGLPVQPTQTDAVHHLLAATAAALHARGEKASGLFLHHRLDQGTSGLVVFARDEAANRGLGRAFAEREVEKVYLALVRPRPGVEPPARWSVADRLDRRRDTPGGKALTVAAASGREAITDFRLLERREETLLVEARPRTGRTHQIRVHLADGGLPVAGDTLYGESRQRDERLWLHAWRLALLHPVTGRPLALESPPPVELRPSAPSAREAE